VTGARRGVRVGFALSFATIAGVGVGAAGCGGSSQEPAVILVSAQWNDNPATADTIGYQVLVDVGWRSRPQDCFPLSPDLRVHVNDFEVPVMPAGDCEFDFLVKVGAFLADTPVTVTLEDGGTLIGQASFTGLFPGFAAHLVSPADGQVHPGDPIVLSVPSQGYLFDSTYGEVFWRDTPASVPPYSTYLGPGALSADGQSYTLTTPATTGRAALILKSFGSGNYAAAQSCVGFQSCSMLPEYMTLGPALIDVVP
jgi:hypothetical protein